MIPQIITYGKGGQVTQLDGTNTFLIDSSDLKWGNFYTPTIFVEGIEKDKLKFDFYKAYENSEGIVLHCEYRSTSTNHILIVHTNGQ